MTDDELKQLVASLAIGQREVTQSQRELTEQQKKTDIQLAKTDAQLAKTSQKLDRLGELVGNISNNQGDIAEEFFYRSFKKNPVLNNIRFDSVSRNMNNSIEQLEDEYDIVLINGDTLAIIEVKAKAHIKDLEKMIAKKVVNFPKLFHAYQNYHLYAGVATLLTNNDLIEKAQELGLFLLTQQGDHTAIVQTGRLLH
jgi:hypothetical protein